MPVVPLQNPGDMTSERRSNLVGHYKMQDLYWRREEITDPDDLADIDRQMIDFLLELSDDDFAELELRPMEIVRLKRHRQITKRVRARLRIFCSGVTYSTIGT